MGAGTSRLIQARQTGTFGTKPHHQALSTFPNTLILKSTYLGVEWGEVGPHLAMTRAYSFLALYHGVTPGSAEGSGYITWYTVLGDRTGLSLTQGQHFNLCTSSPAPMRSLSNALYHPGSTEPKCTSTFNAHHPKLRGFSSRTEKNAQSLTHF